MPSGVQWTPEVCSRDLTQHRLKLQGKLVTPLEPPYSSCCTVIAYRQKLIWWHDLYCVRSQSRRTSVRCPTSEGCRTVLVSLHHLCLNSEGVQHVAWPNGRQQQSWSAYRSKNCKQQSPPSPHFRKEQYLCMVFWPVTSVYVVLTKIPVENAVCKQFSFCSVCWSLL